MKRKTQLPEISDIRAKYDNKKGQERKMISFRFPQGLKKDLEKLAKDQGYCYNFTELMIALGDYWLTTEKGKNKKV